MVDPLWTSMTGNNLDQREQLKHTIQPKKLDEVYSWFEEHFVKCSQKEYLERCPFVIFQGPTGCGKTSVLRCISHDLGITIKEYSETTDTLAIDHDIEREDRVEEQAKLSYLIDKRKAEKFERFCIHHIRYNTLYPSTEVNKTQSNGFKPKNERTSGLQSQGNTQQPHRGGIIIHIDTLMTFAKSQRILMNTLLRLLQIIRKISPTLKRRVAIVFETLEGDNDIITLSTKAKHSLHIRVFKFNPITRANMKRLIESLKKDLKHVEIDKETTEQIISDCDGDVRACINTLQLICNKSSSSHIFKQIDHNSFNGNELSTYKLLQATKKQKLMNEKVRQVTLNPSLMRDISRSCSFFHVLGKIFYQKRLYPNPNSCFGKPKRYRSVDRPYPTENTTDHLIDLLGVDPKNLIAWLHQHYYIFCKDSNIDKAAVFLENLSVADTLSINSLQSTQFYEMHHAIDQLQLHLSIESTVFSLYEDQTSAIVADPKKGTTKSGSKIIKSSVETTSSKANELYSFNKPVSMDLAKLVEDYKSMLTLCHSEIFETGYKSTDVLAVLLDYAPYINHMFNDWAILNPEARYKYCRTRGGQIDKGAEQNYAYLLRSLFTTLDMLNDKTDLDLDARHEKMIEMIEEMVESQKTHTTEIK